MSGAQSCQITFVYDRSTVLPSNFLVPEDTSSKIRGLQFCQVKTAYDPDRSVTTVVLTVVNGSERVVFNEFESLECFDDPVIH